MKKIIPVCVLLGLGLGGCFKDKEFDDRNIQATQPNGNQNIIEIGINATNVNNFRIRVLGNLNRDTTIAIIPVVLNSAQPAKEDIKVTLIQDATLLTELNTAQGTNYAIPTGMYTIENTNNVVTIPKGSNVGYLRARLKPSDFIGGEWALPYRIGTIETGGYTTSGNLTEGILAIAIRNDYDATYRATGFFSHPTSPRTIGRNKRLTTVSETTVRMELGDLGTATTVDLTINPDNTVTITPGPGANPATAGIPGDPVYNNTYDPATRTFYVKYGYPTNRILTERLVRQ